MLQDVNATDLLGAIALGCQTMGNVFNRDDRDLPYFGTEAWPNPQFTQSEHHGESHIPGRHLNALLMAEAFAGVTVSEEVIAKHAQAAYYSFSGPIPMALNRRSDGKGLVGDPVFFLDHNIREGLHALYALSRFRGDTRADGLMRRAIDFIQTHFVPQLQWDHYVTQHKELSLFFSPYIAGPARAIGPLVKYFRSSGYAPALELALCLGEKAKESYPRSGEFDLERMGTTHAHSIACVLSSLAQLAQTTGDRDLLERVRNFYDKGMQTMRNQLGWVTETVGKEAPARGECNTSGDLVETALILGAHYGGAYYDDAERIIRGHILPAQLRDVRFIHNPENPAGKDRLDRVAERHVGAFGFPAPYGHQPLHAANISFNMDIVGGTVASLCEAWAAATAYEGGIHRVNLLFDRQTDAIRVTSPYSESGLTVTALQPGPVFVRIPSWADPKTMRQACANWTVCGDYLCITTPTVGKPIAIDLPLSERTLEVRSYLHTLRAKLRGDIVLAMDNEGTDFTFFPAFQSCTDTQ